MLTLLSSLLGFGTSFVPKILDFVQDKSDKAQELKIMALQIEREVSSQGRNDGFC